ncbi:DUF4184 family protein [Micromonospora rosaria]|uniref:DUF4184 family protein n=1 Tax=Micromonospora rosaria TaxID=47874 RepID=UPI000AE74FDB
MPLTFPSHPAAIVPLKLSRPRWFDGTALIFGSMAPDLAYVLDGSGLPVGPFSHQLPGLVGWCVWPTSGTPSYGSPGQPHDEQQHRPSGSWWPVRQGLDAADRPAGGGAAGYQQRARCCCG